MVTLNEVYEFCPSSICESDNSATLAQVTGEFFAVDASSRNGRFYSRGLWEKVLKDSAATLADKKMLGFLGHGTIAADENLHNVAMITTDLHIDKASKGIGTYEVLDTVPGRALNALLRAGVKLAVSSRASGTYLKEKRNGLSVVDPSTFALSHFDIVREGGVASATPSLVESLNESLGDAEQAALREFLEYEEEPAEAHKGEDHMDTSIFETLAREKAELESKLTESLDAATESTKAIAVLESKVSEMTASLAEASSKTEAVIAASKTAADEASVQLEAYGKLGTAEQISEALTIATSYSDIGTPEQFSDALAAGALFEDLGTVADVSAVFDLVESYAKLGTVDQFAEVLVSVETMLDEKAAATAEKEIESLVEKTGVSKQSASKLLSTLSFDEAVALAEEMSTSLNIGETYRKPAASPTETAHESTVKKSRGQRMYETY